MSANLQLAPQQTQKFQIRLLGADDLAHFEAHMLRLSDACRRLRFGTHVSDAFLRGYAQRVDLRNTAVLGVFVDGEMRGAAELRSFAVTWGHDAEGAFTGREAIPRLRDGQGHDGRIGRLRPQAWRVRNPPCPARRQPCHAQACSGFCSEHALRRL